MHLAVVPVSAQAGGLLLFAESGNSAAAGLTGRSGFIHQSSYVLFSLSLQGHQVALSSNPAKTHAVRFHLLASVFHHELKVCFALQDLAIPLELV